MTESPPIFKVTDMIKCKYLFGFSDIDECKRIHSCHVNAAGTKMPTTRVPANRCGTQWPGWLDGTHPAVEDGEVVRKVCFTDRSSGCKATKTTSVKNCGSYFIYKLQQPSYCNYRYCGTD